MAPEQAAGRVDEIDERTDVFALGALLYHVMAGRPPYDGPTLKSLIDQALDAKPASVKSLEPGVPTPLQRIIERAMARAREDRFPTAGEVATALERSMTDALTESTSTSVRVVINMLTLVGAIVICLAVAVLSQGVSSLEQQGPVGKFALVLLFVGLGLTGIEWRTRGRYALSTLSLVFAGLTLLVAVATTVTNLEITLHVVGAKALLDDPRQFRALAVEGAFEALGGLTLGALYTGVQLFCWALIHRRQVLSKAGA
jgi:hypothetical protein